MNESVLDFLTHFVDLGRTDAFGLFKQSEGRKGYVKRDNPGGTISREVLVRHLNGEQPIGIYMMTPKGVRLATIDLDNHDGDGSWGDMQATAKKLCDILLTKHGIKPFVVSSGGGQGIHIHIIFKNTQAPRVVRRVLKKALAQGGLSEGTSGGVKSGVAEIFPKRDSLEEGKFGALIALPFGRESRPLDPVTMQPISLNGWPPTTFDDLFSPDIVDEEGEEVAQKAGKEPASGSRSKIGKALERINADDYDTWIRVALGLKNELGEAGYPMWVSWSRQSSKFSGEETCQKKWNGLQPDGQIGFGSIFHMAGQEKKAATNTARQKAPLRPSVLTAQELAEKELPPRKYIISEWLPEGGLAMVSATRGIGKTWFGLYLGLSVAIGKEFLGYDVTGPYNVLYVDGEMSLSELQERLKGLTDGPQPERFRILPSELLYRAGDPLNINEEEDQQRLLDLIEQLATEGGKPALVILDNLSALTSGLDENDNSALDKILRWFLQLRHSNVAVLVVHHTGKSGEQRGASRREDLLDTSIKLAAPEAKKGEKLAPHSGAHFTVDFVKTRGRKPNPAFLEVKLIELPDGKLVWSTTSTHATFRDQILKVIATEKPLTQQEIARHLDRSKGNVSSYCKGLRKEGLLAADDQPTLTTKGKERVLELWPELYDQVAEQDEFPI